MNAYDKVLVLIISLIIMAMLMMSYVSLIIGIALFIITILLIISMIIGKIVYEKNMKEEWVKSLATEAFKEAIISIYQDLPLNDGDAKDS